jgi:hypothetical protein
LYRTLGVLVGDVVAVGVGGDRVQAVVAGGALEVAGDDVPADAALREVVERGHPARERVRMLERRGRRDSEPEVLGDGCHRGYDQ